jgi:hypothetical protein
MKPEDIVEAIRQFTEISREPPAEHFAIASERAIGAAIGALIAAFIFVCITPPSIAGAFLFAAFTVAGRTVGASSGIKRLRTARKPSWEHVELLTRTLKQLGVHDEWLGIIVKTIMETGPSVELLNDPAHILRILPEEVFRLSVQSQGELPSSMESPTLALEDNDDDETKQLNAGAR